MFVLFLRCRRHYWCNLQKKKTNKNFFTITSPGYHRFFSREVEGHPSSCRGCCSASLTSRLHSNVTGGPPSNSDEDLWGWAKELRLRKNETPVADLRASSGSLHIVKARGCFQWLHLHPSPHRLHQAPTCWFISAVVLNVFPHPERRELIRFTHVCQEIHFGGKKNMQFIWGKRAPLAPVSCLKPHSATDPRRSVMDAHRCL